MVSFFTMAVIAGSVYANHQILVGPRTGYHSSEDKRYHRYDEGFLLGYRYNFNVGNMFQMDAGLENTTDIMIGFNDRNEGTLLGTDMLLEPGFGLLFTALIPFTARFRTGFSYRSKNYSWTYTNPDIFDSHYGSNGFGFFYAPGLFFQNDIGYIGCILTNRLHFGRQKMEYNGGDDFSDGFREKMMDWGFEAGLNGRRVSHTLAFVFSRRKSTTNDTWSSWKDTRSTKSLTYKIGINLPEVLKLPRIR